MTQIPFLQGLLWLYTKKTEKENNHWPFIGPIWTYITKTCLYCYVSTTQSPAFSIYPMHLLLATWLAHLFPNLTFLENSLTVEVISGRMTHPVGLSKAGSPQCMTSPQLLLCTTLCIINWETSFLWVVKWQLSRPGSLGEFVPSTQSCWCHT